MVGNSQDVGVLVASCCSPQKTDELWPTASRAASRREHDSSGNTTLLGEAFSACGLQSKLRVWEPGGLQE